MADRRSPRGYLADIKAQIDQTTALEKAAKAGDPEAALKLGEIQAHFRRHKKARAAFDQAIGSGHPDYAAAASNSLGNLLRQDGDQDGARAAYQQAIESGHHEWAPVAAANLGMMLADAGDAAGARDAFRQAASSGHPVHAPWTAIRLAGLLEQVGDTTGALAAYQVAADWGTPSGRRAPRPPSATSCGRPGTWPGAGRVPARDQFGSAAQARALAEQAGGRVPATRGPRRRPGRAAAGGRYR